MSDVKDMLKKMGSDFKSYKKYHMSQKDKRLFLESVSLIIIYLFSFLILSVGRVPESFFGLSASTFSNIQLIFLTFIFAVIITLVLFFAYKQVVK